MSEGILGCLGCFGLFVLGAALYVAVGALSALIIEWAWNFLAPALFHGPRIDFTMAFVLYVALSIIAGLFHSQGQS